MLLTVAMTPLAFAPSCGGSTAETAGQRVDGGASGIAGSGGASGAGGSTGGIAGSGGASGAGGSTGGSAGAAGTSGAAGVGAAGTAGAGPDAGDAGDMAPGVCTSDGDCRIAIDCCLCAALGPLEESGGCGDICGAFECARWSVRPDDARCVAGRCVIDRRCDQACGELSCAPGNLPFTNEDGSCGYRCLPPTECSAVASCSVCDAVGAACVIYLTAGRGSETYHCVDVPEGCDGSCECMRVCSTGTECLPQNDSRALLCYRDCPEC